ncbi:Pyridoxal phosphate-dependent transferase, major domain protein [Metarhizium album ARSEF 1941]|uniref:aromatic-amino-acid transaminase n=1 Tax=Metarhizium album (strain ARSEF 1941) TaxID=1081103 RepID=A0A0B2WR17_METAS|nr:Pyridoxal phosphate-dependent transferase, major domain protein [Metarhizium album ARSEF 1941]KHN98506.1 Pyridoxal phosphate-dependent transferase, major domain protein [Metarhizium album ARSEF 1941]
MPVATPHKTVDGHDDQSQPAPPDFNDLSSHAAATALNGSKNGTTSSPSVIDVILARRAKAGKLVAGVAAASDSDMWKGPQTGKPKARRWESHLSKESLGRQPCTLKLAAKHLKKPGLISLGGGLPSSETFPFAELSMKVPVAPHFSERETLENGQTVTIGKYDVRDHDAVYDLSIALNYGQSTGSAQMMRFLTEHTEIVCNPPYADWRICQTIGSTGALEQAFRMFCDRDRGDSVLTEDFSFSTALETVIPLGIKVFGSPIDDEGLVPEAMDMLLTNWDAKERGARKPHLLYTVPSGQNPTGATQGAGRRKAIYCVCQKHDVFIIEDEPYYFLQMQPYTGRNQPGVSPPSTVEEFVSSLIPTYVSMDIDGRVLRMDSVSKVLVPGSRLGWVVGSEQIIERYQRHAEVASQGPSGFSQIILYKLLDETWGHEGYLRWLMNLRMQYTKRRDALLAACEKHLPQEIVSWTPPAAGMFLWLHVDYAKHPYAATKSLVEVEEEIFDSCIDGGVLVARGSWFLAEKEKPMPGLFFRATFAAASAESMDEAIKRFGQAVLHSFGNK